MKLSVKLLLTFLPVVLFAQHWTSDYRMTEFEGASLTSLNNARCIAVSYESIIHVVYMEENYIGSNQFGVCYNRSFDYGQTWYGWSYLYCHSGVSAEYPAIVTSGNFIHVVFVLTHSGGSPGKIVYMRSTNGGDDWTWNPTELTSDWINSNPAITVNIASPQYINVVWRANIGSDLSIKTIQSSTAGASWGPVRILYENSQDQVLGPPSITSEGQRVHAAWNRYRLGHSYVVYARSIDFGANWENPYDLPGSGDIDGTGAPSISAATPFVHIVWPYWTLTRNEYDLKHLMSQNSGETWEEMTILASTSINPHPTVTIDQANIVHVVWKDVDRIYYRRSLDAGISWQQTAHIVISNYTSYPSLACKSLNDWTKDNGIYLLWTDERDGNKEIYFKRGWQIDEDATYPNEGRHLVRVVNKWDLKTAFQGDNAIFYQSLDGNCAPPTPVVISEPIAIDQGKYPSIAVTSRGHPWVCYTTIEPPILKCAIKRNQYPDDWRTVNVFEWPRPDGIFAPSLVLATPFFGTPDNMGYVVCAMKLGGVSQIRFFAFDSLGVYYETTLDYGSDNISVLAPSIAVTPKDLIHVTWQRTEANNEDTISRIYYITTLEGVDPRAIRQGYRPVWSDPYQISTQDPLTEPASNPFVEAQGEKVFVVWRGPNEYEQDIGEIWQREGIIEPGQLPEWRDPRNVSLSRDEESNYPTMSTGIAVVWQESLPDRHQIYGEIQGQVHNLSNNELNCKYPHTNVIPTEPWYQYRWRLLTVWTQEKMPGIYQIEYGHYDFNRRLEPIIAVDGGKIIPSKYLIDRLGYIDFGDYSVDYAFELIYKLCYLHPDKYYLLEAICYNDTTTKEKFVFEDSATKTIRILPSDPETLGIMLRPNHYEDAECLLKIRKLIGEYAVLAKMYLYEFEILEGSGSGPQSLSAYDNYDFIPSTTILHMPIPNPFKGRLLIRYQLAQTSKVSLSIYDVQGRRIRTLVNEICEPGFYEQVWDVRDDRGRKVPTGVYFYRLETDDYQAVNKVVLMR